MTAFDEDDAWDLVSRVIEHVTSLAYAMRPVRQAAVHDLAPVGSPWSGDALRREAERLYEHLCHGRDARGRAGLLFHLYEGANEAGVLDFLSKDASLIDVLAQGYKHVCRIFGPVRPRLTVFASPESSDERELHVLIPTRLEVADALVKLETFDEEWWLDAPLNARTAIVFDVHCR